MMRQVWTDLLFLHWEVAADALRPLLPPELDVDTHDGRAYAGLVPFGMSGVRPVFFPPLPGLSRFLEVNVRTYVRNRSDGEPGVWFFSLDAANRVAVAAARASYHLPYHFARMRMDRSEGIEPSATHPTIRYVSQRASAAPGDAHCELVYRPTGFPVEAQPGTLEHFLVERYVLFARRNETLYRGRVTHLPYRIQGAELGSLRETLIAAAGIERSGDPGLIHYSPGVDVRIHLIRPAKS